MCSPNFYHIIVSEEEKRGNGTEEIFEEMRISQVS